MIAAADKMAAVDEIEVTDRLLPGQTVHRLIEGADHYQFGYFDKAPVNASFSREQQQQALLQALQNRFRPRTNPDRRSLYSGPPGVWLRDAPR